MDRHPLTRRFRALAILTGAVLFLSTASSVGWSQVIPALWEIEDSGQAYASLAGNLREVAATRPAFNEDERFDPGQFGCLIGGTIGAIAIFADPNLVSFLAGEAVAAGPAAIYAAIGGAIIVSACALAQAVGPIVVDLYRRYVSPYDKFPAVGRRSDIRGAPVLDPGQ